MISLIVAMDKKRTIGRGKNLPWRLPADLAYFKKITMGHTVIMGRKTFESIGKPLPGRDNVVITQRADYHPEGCRVLHSVDEALTLNGKEKEIFVIGGAEVYRQFFPYAGRLYVTRIEEAFEGDVFFPEIDPEEWRLVSERRGRTDEKNPYRYYFCLYERRK